MLRDHRVHIVRKIRKGLIVGLLMSGCGGPALGQSESPWLAAPRPDPGWAARHFELQGELVKENPKVLFLGDSITARWASTGKVFWDESFAPLKAFNAGIEGETSQGLLWRIRQGEFRRVSPSIVLLMIGTNNLYLTDDRAITLGIEAVVRELHGEFGSANIVVLGILPRDGVDSPRRAEIRRINHQLKLDASAAQYGYCDLGPNLLEVTGELDRKAYQSDGVHLATEGYRRIVAGIVEAISDSPWGCSSKD